MSRLLQSASAQGRAAAAAVEQLAREMPLRHRHNARNALSARWVPEPDVGARARRAQPRTRTGGSLPERIIGMPVSKIFSGLF